MKRKLAIGISISLFFIYLSFFIPNFSVIFSGDIVGGFFSTPRIDLKSLVIAFKSANIIVPFILIAMNYLGWWIRAWRYQVLVMPVKPIGARLSFSAMMIGYLGNTILPLRAGEFMRAFVVGKRGDMPVSSSLAVLVVERIVDMVMLLICFGITLLIFPMPGFFKNAGIITLLLTGVMMVFLFLLLFKRDKALKIASRILAFLPETVREKIMNVLLDFTEGLEIFRKSEHYFMAIAYTLVMWCLYLAIIYTSLHMFDFITPRFPAINGAPLGAALVMLTITTAGIALPSAPGAVGTYHGIALFGLGLFGVPPELGMSYAILIHLSNFGPMTVVGLYCLIREGFKLADLTGMMKKKPASTSTPISK